MTNIRINSLHIPRWPTRDYFRVSGYGPGTPNTLWLHTVTLSNLTEFLHETLRWHRQLNVWQLLVACVSRGAITTPGEITGTLNRVADTRRPRIETLGGGWISGTDHRLSPHSFRWDEPTTGPKDSVVPPMFPLSRTPIIHNGVPATKFGPGYAFEEAMDLTNPAHRLQLKDLLKTLKRAQHHVTPVEAMVCRQIESYLSFYLNASGGYNPGRLK